MIHVCIPSSGEPGRTAVNSRLCEWKPLYTTKPDPAPMKARLHHQGRPCHRQTDCWITRKKRSKNKSEPGSGKWPQRTHGFFPVTFWVWSGPASPCSILNHGNLAQDVQVSRQRGESLSCSGINWYVRQGKRPLKRLQVTLKKLLAETTPNVWMETKEKIKLLHYFGIESKGQTFCNVFMSLRNSHTHSP